MCTAGISWPFPLGWGWTGDDAWVGWDHSRELLVGVDRLAEAVEVRVAHPVRVVVAAVGVAEAREPIVRVGSAAVVRLADVVLVVLAGMRRQGESARVGLPVRCLLVSRA